VEDIRFDAMVKALGSQQGSRRLTLGALLGGAISCLGLAGTEAKRSSGSCKPTCGECEACKKGDCKKAKHGKKCKKGRCKAKAEGTPCTSSTGGSGTCQNRVCVTIAPVAIVCADGTTNCGGACVNTTTDIANCGTCGIACTGTQVCQASTCFTRSTCPPTIRSLCEFVVGTPCSAVSSLDSCFCARSTEGNVVCVLEDLDPEFCTIPPSCTGSADCLAGEACVNVSGCCSPSPLPPRTGKCLAPCPAPAA